MKNLDDLWISLQTAKESLLILDYEGTLTLPSIDQSIPVPYPWVNDVLQEILTGGTKIGIISDHSVDEVTQVIPYAAEIEIWGMHGTEMRRHEETLSRFILSTEIKAGFKHAVDRVKIAGWRKEMTMRHGSLGVSWTKQTSAEAAKMKVTIPKLLTPILRNEDFVLIEYPDKYELRTRFFDKSSAVAFMILESDIDAVITYIGDDETDDDAFRMLKGIGYGILVSEKSISSPAHNWLKSPKQLNLFLDKWSESIADITL